MLACVVNCHTSTSQFSLWEGSQQVPASTRVSVRLRLTTSLWCLPARLPACPSCKRVLACLTATASWPTAARSSRCCWSRRGPRARHRHRWVGRRRLQGSPLLRQCQRGCCRRGATHDVGSERVPWRSSVGLGVGEASRDMGDPGWVGGKDLCQSVWGLGGRAVCAG